MLKLLSWISWPYFRHRPLKALLTLLGMACGIAVFSAIQIANQSVSTSFQNTLELFRGDSDVSLEAAARLPQNSDFAEILKLPEVQAATPVLEIQAQCASGKSLIVLGIDPISRAAFFPHPERAERPSSIPFEIIATPGSAWIHPDLLQDCPLLQGQLELTSSGQKILLRAKVLNSNEQSLLPAKNLILVDIATAQEFFGKAESLSRIEVLLANPKTETQKEALRQKIPSGLGLSSKQESSQQGQELLQAFQYNLLSLGLVSIFVAVFIVYNAASLAVLYRRSELGVLRALGTSRPRVARLFLTEILGMGILSSFLGIALAWLIARLIFDPLLETASTQYLGATLGELKLSGINIVSALAIGVFASTSGAAIPLAEVLSITPIEATRKFSYEKHLRRRPGVLLILSLVLAALAIGSASIVSWDRPYFSFLVAFGALLSALVLTPFLMRILLKPFRWLGRKLKLPALYIAAAQILENPYRYSVVTAALALAVALWLGIGMMVQSFRYSVVDWIEGSIRGDIYLRLPENQRGASDRFQYFLPQDWVENLRQNPRVERSDQLRAFFVELKNKKIQASAIELEQLLSHGSLQILAGDRNQFLNQLSRSNLQEPIPVAIAESLSTKKNLKLNDVFATQTSWGLWKFRVGLILYDYTSDQGILYLNFRDFKQRVPPQDWRANALALYLKDPRDAENLRAEILKFPGKPPSLQLQLNQELKSQVLGIFDQTFQVTQGLKVVALLVAFLGILTTLALLLEEKRREVGLLQALGMTPRQVAIYGLSQGFLLATAGAVLGTLSGFLLSGAILNYVQYYFFGWSIFWHWDWSLILQGFLLTFLTGGIASLWSIDYLVRRFQVAEALKCEE